MTNKITFKSKILQDKDVLDFKFDAPVTISKFGEFEVFEFLEPEHKVANRIEVSESNVNIFAGPSTINLELKNEVLIEYTTPHGTLFLTSFLSELKNKNNKDISFTYTLSNKDKVVIGTYEIGLEIN